MGSRRHTLFMDNNLQLYQETLNKANEHMKTAIEQMRYGIHDRWLRRENINPLCLTFQDLKWELPYIRQPDPLFKFYVGCAFLVLLCMLAVQAINMPSDHWIVWTGFGVSLGIVFLLLPFLWTLYVWNLLKNPYGDNHQETKPDNRFLLMLYNYSRKVVTSAAPRTIIFLLLFVLLAVCSMLEFVECDTGPIITTRFSEYEKMQALYHCIPPWQLAHTCDLAVIMTFLFLKIHFQLKLLVGLIFVAVYSVCVMVLRPQLFVDGETWNPDLDPKVAHVMNIVFLTVTMHLLDRQAEFMMRLDYHWLRQLSQEQEDVSTTRKVNTLLLENILPLHVAQLYLDTNRNYDKLYHEEHDSVAVMFASLTEYTLYDEENPNEANERSSLVLLNQIICDFDMLLIKPCFERIEKIKVAGWTYMAACGLELGRRDSSTSFSKSASRAENIVLMAKFATKMMKALRSYNKETFQSFNLRVGISHGPITAGVVGAQKPLYDIWGDAVNMASRMDSTGEPGKIQVTPETASVLLQEGVDCEYRGEIFVKGKGLVKTSFVCVDSDFKLVRRLIPSITSEWNSASLSGASGDYIYEHTDGSGSFVSQNSEPPPTESDNDVHDTKM